MPDSLFRGVLFFGGINFRPQSLHFLICISTSFVTGMTGSGISSTIRLRTFSSSTCLPPQPGQWSASTISVTSGICFRVVPLCPFGAPRLAPFLAFKPLVLGLRCLLAEDGVLEFLYFISSFSSSFFSFSSCCLNSFSVSSSSFSRLFSLMTWCNFIMEHPHIPPLKNNRNYNYFYFSVLNPESAKQIQKF